MKILKFGGDVSHRPVSLFEKKKKKTVAVNKDTKADIKLF